MNLVFDIDEENYVSVTIVPDASESEADLHGISQKLYIRSPGASIVSRAKAGAFNHLSEEQYNTYLHKIKTLEKFFNYDGSNSAIKQKKVNIFMLLERLINAYINLDDEGGCEE